MNKTYSIFAAVAMSVIATPAFAAPERGKPPPAVSAIMQASPTLQAIPGAAAEASSRAARDGVTTKGVSKETFGGTSVSMHSEDQCVLFNLNVNRYSPPNGQTTTYFNYDSRNICDSSQNASASFELPDSVFTGDPRTAKKVKVKFDLTNSGSNVFGPAANVNLVFTKTDALISKSTYKTTTTTNDNGVKKVLSFNTKSVNNSAKVTGSVTLGGGAPLPLNNGYATINYDDTVNTTAIK